MLWACVKFTWKRVGEKNLKPWKPNSFPNVGQMNSNRGRGCLLYIRDAYYPQLNWGLFFAMKVQDPGYLNNQDDSWKVSSRFLFFFVAQLDQHLNRIGMRWHVDDSVFVINVTQVDFLLPPENLTAKNNQKSTWFEAGNSEIPNSHCYRLQTLDFAGCFGVSFWHFVFFGFVGFTSSKHGGSVLMFWIKSRRM